MSCFSEGKIQRGTCLPPGSPGHPRCLRVLQERTVGGKKKKGRTIGTGVLDQCLRQGGASSWRGATEADRGSQPPPEPHSAGRRSQPDPMCRASSTFGKQNNTLLSHAPNHIGHLQGFLGPFFLQILPCTDVRPGLGRDLVLRAEGRVGESPS